MTKTNETITHSIDIVPKFRGTVFCVATQNGEPSFVTEWHDTYEAAQEQMLEHLVDVGIGFAGEIEKVYMTTNTWDKVLNKPEETTA